MTQQERRIWLIRRLMEERPEYRQLEIPADPQGQKQLLRSLMNVRSPRPIPEEFLKIQDEYLSEELQQKEIITLRDLTPIQENIYLWKGDITALAVDAIVNAANSALLGCFIPCHGCIDNAIHSAAGLQLREACYDIMSRQNREEETGKAKITPAFNLPSRNVIHTVGPIIRGILKKKDCDLLASCYRSCLELAARHELSSIAFCCISTGEFHFPSKAAADIAVQTVQAFLQEWNSSHKNKMEVIFNVFKEKDYDIYRSLLSERKRGLQQGTIPTDGQL